MTTKTDNYGFELIDFDKTPWHERDWDNWRLLDSVFSQFIAIANLKGVWTNSLSVAVGDRYVDTDLGTIWTVEIAHTTASNGSFATDRDALGGDYWSLFSTIDATSVGQWTTATAYTNNTYLHDSNRFGVTTATYTSSGSYDTDVANGNIITLIDLTTSLAAAAASATAASNSATNSASSATDAAASAASLNLPDPITADLALFGNSGGTAWEQKSASDARTALELEVPSQAEAEAGTATTQRVWTAERIKQAIDALAGQTAFTTGDVKATIKTTADTGWVMMDDGTIGNGSSGASTRANADTEELFELLWNNIDNAYAAVSSGRGASAQDDFDANKTIALPKALGRALAVSGTGSGLTARSLGETLGAEDAITVAHTHGAGSFEADSGGAHTHDVAWDSSAINNSQTVIQGTTDGQTPNQSTATDSDGAHTHAISGTSASTGSSATDANMPPEVFLNIMIKL